MRDGNVETREVSSGRWAAQWAYACTHGYACGATTSPGGTRYHTVPVEGTFDSEQEAHDAAHEERIAWLFPE